MKSRRKRKPATAKGYAIQNIDGAIWVDSTQRRGRDVIDNYSMEIGDRVVRVLVTEVQGKKARGK